LPPVMQRWKRPGRKRSMNCSGALIGGGSSASSPTVSTAAYFARSSWPVGWAR
jgi:hypothetical protein